MFLNDEKSNPRRMSLEVYSETRKLLRCRKVSFFLQTQSCVLYVAILSAIIFLIDSFEVFDGFLQKAIVQPSDISKRAVNFFIYKSLNREYGVQNSLPVRLLWRGRQCFPDPDK
jgi:hypothetical protein